MTATAILIADAVTAEINKAVAAGAFTISGFTARRSYADWDADFKDLKDIAVDVVFRSSGKLQMLEHSKLRYEPAIHVAVRKRFEQSTDTDTDGRLKTAAVDPIVSLLEEIYELFAGNRNGTVLADQTTAKWDGDESLTRWVNQSKLRQGLFEGWLEIIFRMPKAI